jgi:prevent-host-death family protein
MQVTIPEASRRLAQLIRSVQAGDEVLIAEGETPVARLLPVTPATKLGEEPGRARTILDWLAYSPVPPASRRSAEEIDAAIVAERAAWDCSISTHARLVTYLVERRPARAPACWRSARRQRVTPPSQAHFVRRAPAA